MADFLTFGQGTYASSGIYPGTVTLPGLATFSLSAQQGQLYPPDARFHNTTKPIQYTSTGQPLPHPFDMIQTHALATLGVYRANGGSLR